MQPILEVVHDAQILLDPKRNIANSCVVDASRNSVELALHLHPGMQGSHIVQNEACQSHIEGCAIFGGWMFAPHFGHMLIESIGRLWAASYLVNKLPIVFLPGFQQSRSIPSIFYEFSRLLGINSHLCLLDCSTSVERLIVPSQLLGLGDYISSHPEFIQFVSGLKSRIPSQEVLFKKIYVSRARLSKSQGCLIGEAEIESNFRNNGYHVIYPELMSLNDQLHIYNSAEYLVFSEGSALHLYGFIGNARQQVGIISRRWGANVFVKQIKAFSGAHVSVFQCSKSFIIPIDHAHPSANAANLLDFVGLKNQLIHSGFLSPYCLWQLPSELETRIEVNSVIASYASRTVEHSRLEADSYYRNS